MSSYWLGQEVWGSVKFEMRYDHKDRTNSNISLRKEVFQNALTTWDLITWITRIFFQVPLEEGMLIVTVITTTECLPREGRALILRALCEGGTWIPLHGGRGWQIRRSQGRRPNWQAHFQLGRTPPTLKAFLPHHPLLSLTTTLHLLPFTICEVLAFLFLWKDLFQWYPTPGCSGHRGHHLEQGSTFSWRRPGRNVSVTGKNRPIRSIYITLPPEIGVLSKGRVWTRGRDGNKGS